MKQFDIFIISHLRPENVKKMQDFLNVPCTWIVGKGETEAYKQAGAISVVEGGTLVESRNKALELAFERDHVCVQVSDDLKKIKKVVASKMEDPSMTFNEVLEIFEKEIWHSPFFLYGIPPTDNAFYVHKQRSLNNFIIGDFMVVKPNELRFDPEFPLKEDYEYNAQHIKKFGGIMRFDTILFSFQHYSNAGGVVSYRNESLEAEVVEKLLKKHPGLFRKNPKRKNEVLLVAPKVRK